MAAARAWSAMGWSAKPYSTARVRTKAATLDDGAGSDSFIALAFPDACRPVFGPPRLCQVIARAASGWRRTKRYSNGTASGRQRYRSATATGQMRDG